MSAGVKLILCVIQTHPFLVCPVTDNWYHQKIRYTEGKGWTSVALADSNCAAMDADGQFYVWGWGYICQRPPVDGGYVAMSYNVYSYAAIKANGTVRCTSQSSSCLRI
jgi:hypothetical protein